MSESNNKCNLLKEGYKRYLNGLKRTLEQIKNIDTKTETYLDLYNTTQKTSAFGAEYYNKCNKKIYPDPIYRIVDHAEKMFKAKIKYDDLNLYKNKICAICKNMESEIKTQENIFERAIKEIKKKIEEIERLE